MTLTAGELASMRGVADDYLPDTAVVQTSAYVSDGGGGGTTGWTASGTLPCRLAPVRTVGENEPLTGGRIAPDAEFIITLPFDAAVTEESRVVIDGETYNVGFVRDRSWNVSTRVEATRAE